VNVRTLEIAAVLFSAGGIVALVVGLRVLRRNAQERARINADLRASEQKFAGILDIAADAILTIDDRQQIVHFNQGAEEIFGWKESELLAKPLAILIPERFRGRHEGHIDNFRHAPEVARRMGERREIFGLRRNGREFPAEASISRLEVENGRLFTVVLRDITERKRQQDDERFLARAGATLTTSLDYESTLRSVVHLPVPYLADCCVLDVGESIDTLRRVVSVHEDPDLTKSLRRLEVRRLDNPHWPFPVTSALEGQSAVVRDALPTHWAAEGSPGDDRDRLVTSLGITAMMTVPLIAGERTLGALTLLATDPARHYGPDQRATAEALGKLAAFAIDNGWLYQTSQRALRARDEILGVVSHDLRNPLSAISMCARVLFESPPPDLDAQRELYSAILESTALMDRLIQDLLDVSTLESGHLTLRRHPEALHALVSRVMAMLAKPAMERKVSLRADVDRTLPPVDVDGARIVQVLANLLANAVKFTESGGSVTVSAHADGEAVAVRVSDTGVGVPAEHLPHIFDRYWHARRGTLTVGTGLGLTIARGIVEAHGGQLRAESVVGKGSMFSFTLPRVREAERGPGDSQTVFDTAQST